MLRLHPRALNVALCASLLLGGLLLAPQAVQAQEATPETTYSVAVLNVIAEGADPKLAAQITSVLKSETKRNPHAQLVKQEDIGLLDSLLLLGCEEPTMPCMGQLADYLQAQRLVYARLITVDDLYDIEVNIFDAKAGQVVKRWNKRFTANADAIGFFVKEMEEFLGERTRLKPTRLRVTANVPDAYLVLDGQRVGRTPYFSGELPPGKHRIEVVRDGYKPWVYDLTAAEGSESILQASLERAAPVAGQVNRPPSGPILPPSTTPAPIQVTPEDRGSGTLATLGWVSLGGGVVAASVGGIFGILASSTESELNDTTLQRKAHELRDQGESQALTANIFYGLGGVLGVTGLILIFADSGAEAPASSVSVGPLDTSGTWGVSWEGAW